MATQSIMENIIFSDSKSVKKFVKAIEKSMVAPKKHSQKQINSTDINGSDVKKFLKKIKKSTIKV
ncbi:MAG: hypothetical protein M0Q88_00050 [Bacilli bacterium]|nr:hypothetical protein [Bacilli bacterium]